MTEPIIDRDPGDENPCPRPACRGVLLWQADGSSYCARCDTRYWSFPLPVGGGAAVNP